MFSRLTHKRTKPVADESEHRPHGGWYADPFHEGQMRWFDGCRWTERTMALEATGAAARARPGADSERLHSASEGQARVADLLGDIHRADH